MEIIEQKKNGFFKVNSNIEFTKKERVHMQLYHQSRSNFPSSSTKDWFRKPPPDKMYSSPNQVPGYHLADDFLVLSDADKFIGGIFV